MKWNDQGEFHGRDQSKIIVCLSSWIGIPKDGVSMEQRHTDPKVNVSQEGGWCGGHGSFRSGGVFWLCLWQGIFNTADSVSVFHYRPALPDQESRLPVTSHLVALGGLLQRCCVVAPVLWSGVTDPAQHLLVLLAEPGQLLAMPHTQACPRRLGAQPQPPHAVHQAGQLPVGPEAFQPEGPPTLRTGIEAALCAVGLLAELGDASEAETVAAVHADGILQEIQAHWASGLLAEPLPGGPRGHGGWALPGPADSRAVFPSCLHYLSWCSGTEGRNHTASGEAGTRWALSTG